MIQNCLNTGYRRTYLGLDFRDVSLTYNIVINKSKEKKSNQLNNGLFHLECQKRRISQWRINWFTTMVTPSFH